MTLVLDLPDALTRLLGLDAEDAAIRARQMLVIEGYREGRLSRGQAAEMLELGFHEAEALFKHYDANQQPAWEELERSAKQLRTVIDS